MHKEKEKEKKDGGDLVDCLQHEVERKSLLSA